MQYRRDANTDKSVESEDESVEDGKSKVGINLSSGEAGKIPCYDYKTNIWPLLAKEDLAVLQTCIDK